MIKVGSKVKLNVDVLKANDFDGFIDETEILFISHSGDTVFEVIDDWNSDSSGLYLGNYRYQLNAKELGMVCFSGDELILVEENAE